MNIIGDVAGQYDALVRLLEKMPQERTVFLGDLIDRGPDSRKVVELVRNKHECVAANHEHFMIDWVRDRNWYDDGLWLANGGRATLASYNCNIVDDKFTSQMADDVAWMEKLPLYIETDDLFLSHAPWRSYFSLDEACKVFERGFGGTQIVSDHSLLWCRNAPMLRDNISGKRKLQMFGHNSYWGVRPFYCDEDHDDEEPSFAIASVNPVPIANPMYALCLDNSMMRRLTGAHYDEETKRVTIYQEQYGLQEGR